MNYENKLHEPNLENAKTILSLDWVLVYLRERFPQYQAKSVTPFSETLGSVNHSEDLKNKLFYPNSMLFGKLQLDINPNGSTFADDNITLRIRSFLNGAPFDRHLNRIIEIQNYLNEQTERTELFTEIEFTSKSTLYDSYLTFIGFKIDYN